MTRANSTSGDLRPTPGVAPDVGEMGRSFILLALGWTAFIAGLAAWEGRTLHESAIDLARTEALSSFNNDLVYRRWAAGHGGVYVPVTESTPPSPYLAPLAERDITTPSGRKLTLLNPEHMTRQVHELGKGQYGAQGHITSLKPLRPENAPDPWEAASLKAFDAGARERSSVELIGSLPYLRFMRPLTVELRCLKCHAAQGYQVGDVRGGLSVSVPFQQYDDAARARTRDIFGRYLGIWLLGLGGLWFARRSIQRALRTRAQAEATLRSSEEWHRTILQTAMDGFWLADLEGRLLEVNAAYCRMSGYSAQELLARRIPDLEALETAEVTKAHIQSLIREGEGRFESRHRRKDGSTFDVAVSAQHRPGDGGRFVVFLQDISERKRAEAALLEAKAFSENLIQTANVVFVELNLGGEVVQFNPEAERITGYSMAEAAGKNWFELVAPRARFPEVWAEFSRLIERGEVPRTFENPILTKSGEERQIVWQNSQVCREGVIAGTISFGVDITARKQAEMALRAGEERYRAMFEFAVHGIFQSTFGGRALAANPAFVRMLGYESEDEVLNTLVDLPRGLWANPDERAEVARLIAAQGYVRGYECEFLRKDGTPIWISLNAAVAHGPDEQGSYYHGSIDDITARKQAEQAREALQAQLQQAQKMESVGRLAGGVAHDFNNMLAVILGNVELALQQAEAAQPIAAELEEIRSAAKRSADLTRQLLAYARKQAVAPEVLDLNETVPGLLSMLQRLLGEDINLVWQPGASLWPVTMDPSQLANVLTNLCLNARDAIASVGTIALETANCTFDAGIGAMHANMAPGDYVRLTVRDTGGGMDELTLAHVFEPFFTTKGVGEGTGLGLASVYGAVTQNHGVVTASSALGQGTTINIFLPRRGTERRAERRSTAASVARVGQETILLVEDEPAILRLTTRVLEGRGYAVLAAGSPVEALRRAREHAGEIHLLLSDVVMPEMSGRDLAKSLESLRPHLRLLFMSGHAADVIARRGMLERGVSFLEKPFSIAALLAKVREVLDTR